jgi:hypothetical protein
MAGHHVESSCFVSREKKEEEGVLYTELLYTLDSFPLFR